MYQGFAIFTSLMIHIMVWHISFICECDFENSVGGSFELSEKYSHETIIILDFGSQYTQLIARRIREAGVFCEVLTYNTPVLEIERRELRAIILSGGPSSVYDQGS